MLPALQELNWLPRMVLALTVKEPSQKGPKFAGPAAAMLQLYPRFHLDLSSRLGTYPLHQVRECLRAAPALDTIWYNLQSRASNCSQCRWGQMRQHDAQPCWYSLLISALNSTAPHLF